MKTIEAAEQSVRHLGNMQYIVNNTYYSTIKSASSKVMLDFNQRNHIFRDLSTFINSLTNVNSSFFKKEKPLEAKLLKQQTKLKIIIKFTMATSTKRQHSTSVGDLVLVRDFQFYSDQSREFKSHYKDYL